MDHPYTAHPRLKLPEAKSAEEDWTGLRSRQERRKLQTRLNVRAHRRRKAAAANASSSSETPPPSLTVATKPEFHSTTNTSLIIPSYITANGQRVPAINLSPLSLDHLIPLIQYNVFRATVTNIYLTNLCHLLDTTCTYGHKATAWSTIPVFPSPSSLPLFPGPEDPSSLPPTLQPTALQKRTPHPPWICILPCATMRDNAVRNLHLIDMKDFCADLLPDLVGQSCEENAGMIVWKDPWDARGWEVRPGFLRKWRFLIQGCRELKGATNHYRCIRGEHPLEW